MKVAYVVTSRRLLDGDKLLANLAGGRFNVSSVAEWKFMATKEGDL